MDPVPRDRLALPVSSLLLLTAAVGGLLMYEPPLTSLRPPERGLDMRKSLAGENVESRLWQDPFGPVAAHADELARKSKSERGEEEPIHTLRYTAERVRHYRDQGHSLALLPVMVRGGTFAEDVEQRRRQRQAVVSALAVQRFEPETATHIGYFQTRWNGLSCLAPTGGTRALVPYEWFRPEAGDRGRSDSALEHVLVLWLSEADFQGQPLQRLDQLLGHLRGFQPHPIEEALRAGWKSTPKGSLVLRLVGPAGSTTLRAMLEESAKAKNPEDISHDCKTPIAPKDPTTAAGLASSWTTHLIAVTDGYLERSLEYRGADADGIEVALASRMEVLLEDLPGEKRGYSPEYRAAWIQLVTDGTRREYVKQFEGIGDTDLSYQDNAFDAWSRRTLPSLRGSTAYKSGSLARLDVYSSLATADESELLAGIHPRPAEAKRGECNSVASCLQAVGVRFRSTIPDDRSLAKLLIDELENRGLKLRPPKRDASNEASHASNEAWVPDDLIVLISEWDTIYGRLLPQAVEQAIWERRGQTSRSAIPPGVLRFSYLRGLDGELLVTRSEDDEHKASNGQAFQKKGLLRGSPDRSGTFAELAVGPNQLDHMRRLAAALAARVGIEYPGAHIAAIGVLGSDVYDKQIVLQALHGRFPKAIFFTTDLDARLLHPDAYPWSRNLVVASGYGLELDPEIQQHVPPFRGVYQTSTFLAVQLALGGDISVHLAADNPRGCGEKARKLENGEHLCPVSAQNLVGLLEPQIYEVARSGAYDLTPAAGVSALHPRRRFAAARWRTVGFLALIALAGLALVFLTVPMAQRVFFDWRHLSVLERRNAIGFAVVVVGAGVVLFLLIWIDQMGGSGEPFELWEGISVWPTEVARLISTLLCIGLFLIGLHRLWRNEEALAQRFDLETRGLRQRKTFWKTWWNIRQHYRVLDLHSEAANHRPWHRRLRDELGAFVAAWDRITLVPREQSRRASLADQVWADHRFRGRFANRLTRILPVVGVYLVFGRGLILFAGKPFTPVRGHSANTVDTWLLAFSVGSLIILTFFVVDASRHCVRLVEAIIDPDVHWGKGAREATAREWQVPRSWTDELLAVRLIADRSDVVGSLVTYPFIALFVMLVSRNGFFDQWHWSVPLIVIFSLTSFYALSAAWGLRRAAERARGQAMDRLRERVSCALGGKRPDEEVGEDVPPEGVPPAEAADLRARQLELMAEEIRQTRTGAFTPWSRHPIIKALLIPIGGLGAVALLDTLSLIGL